jgi:hypothetical protein
MVKKLLWVLFIFAIPCLAQDFKVNTLTITGLTPGPGPLCVPSLPGQVTNVGCNTQAGAIFAPSDGIHAGYISLPGKTFNFPLVPNTVGEMGPSVASFPGYALQDSATGPGTGSLVCAGPLSNFSVSQKAFCLPINATTGELSYVHSASGLLAVSDGVHAGASLMACNLFNPPLAPYAQGWAGSTASSTCASYGLNVPAAVPSFAANTYGFMLFPVGTNNYSQSIWSQITTDPSGANLSIPGSLNVTGLTSLGSLVANPTPPTILSSAPVAPSSSQVIISGTSTMSQMPVPYVVSPTTQTLAAYSASGSPTGTWSSAIASGQRIVCGIVSSGSSETFTVTDSASTVYTALTTAQYVPGAVQVIQTFISAPLTAAVTTNTGTASSPSNVALTCNAVSNIATSSPLDGQCGNYSGGSSAGTVTCATAITTTQNKDYLFCTSVQASPAWSVGSGFTAGSGLVTPYYTLNEYLVQPAAGSITPTMVGSTTGLQCVALKAANPAAAAPVFCFDSLATGAWSTATGGNIENAITAVSDNSYHWCYWPSISAWTVK